MGAISLEKSQHMYWLGRYVERVFTTLKTYLSYYDQTLDEDVVLYQEFCLALGIPDVYQSQEVFIENYLFDEQDVSSVASSLRRAFDNAVVLRDEISSESLSYIHLAMSMLEQAHHSRERLVDLQQVLDDLYAFWGSVDDCVESERCRNLMKVGRYQERLDLYVRLAYQPEDVLKTYRKLQKRIEKAGMPYHAEKLECVGGCLGSTQQLKEHRQKLLDCLGSLFV